MHTSLHEHMNMGACYKVTALWMARFYTYMSFCMINSTSMSKSCHKLLNYILYSMLMGHMALPGNVLIESHLTFTKTTQVYPPYTP